MAKDLEQFLAIIPQGEREQLTEVDYFDLLETTFLELKTELEANGNTAKFRDIQKERGQQILTFWRNQAELYKKALQEGKVEEGQPLVSGVGSKLTAGIAQDYDRDDEYILHIQKRSQKEEHEVSITVSEDTGLDEFLHPPRVESKFNREDEELKEYIFEIIFRAGKISTIKRILVHTHKDFQLPFLKQIEILDTSSFGVETPILTKKESGEEIKEE